MSDFINEPFVDSPITQLDFSTNIVPKSETVVVKVPAIRDSLISYNGRYYMKGTISDIPYFSKHQENNRSDYTLKIISALGTAFIATLPKLISTIYNVYSNKKE